MGSLAEINKLVLKSIWENKELRILKTILKMNSEVGRLISPDFRTYYKAIYLKAINQNSMGLA